MPSPGWLTARPIAHRGLHDRDAGILENTLAAARATIAQDYAIECDVQRTADNEAVVFHDFTLDRLTGETGRVDNRDLQSLMHIPVRGGSEGIPSLTALLDAIGGRVPLVCEIKSRFDGDMRLATRVARQAASYAGPLCLESFDPAVVACLQNDRDQLGIAHVPIGLIAQADYGGTAADWAHLSVADKAALGRGASCETRMPDFLSYSVRDLPHPFPSRLRALGIPVTAWTIRSSTEAQTARNHADQIVFEGFLP